MIRRPRSNSTSFKARCSGKYGTSKKSQAGIDVSCPCRLWGGYTDPWIFPAIPKSKRDQGTGHRKSFTMARSLHKARGHGHDYQMEIWKSWHKPFLNREGGELTTSPKVIQVKELKLNLLSNEIVYGTATPTGHLIILIVSVLESICNI